MAVGVLYCAIIYELHHCILLKHVCKILESDY